MEKNGSKRTLIMVQCAMFLAMSIVVRLVEHSFPISAGGVNFMKLGLSAPFILAPGILFGPTYGLIMGLLSDLINLLMPISGPWIPVLTLISGLRGWLVALLWLWIRKSNPKTVKLWITTVFSVTGLLGVFNTVIIKLSPGLEYAKFVINVNEREKGISYIFTYGLIVASGVMLLLVAIASKLEQSSPIYSQRESKNNLFLLLVAVTIPAVVQTTLNTFVLRSIIAQHADIAFMVYYVPRVVKTLIVGVITTFVLNDIILYLYKKLYPNF